MPLTRIVSVPVLAFGFILLFLLRNIVLINLARKTIYEDASRDSLQQGFAPVTPINNINNEECPLAVKKNIGVYDKSKKHSGDVVDDFGDVILLTAANDAYLSVLQNWEYLANELGLKWGVLALDEDLYEKLGPERAVHPGEDAVAGRHRFRKGDFNKIVCNKFKLVLDVVEKCDVDVVFSDADNIFYKNPFEHDLGRLIKSKRYDYVYQSNTPLETDKGHDQCLDGIPHKENNTGFYYFNRKSKRLKEMFAKTLVRCNNPTVDKDDQSIFWNIMRGKMKTDNTFRHCDYNEYQEPTQYNLDHMQSESSFNFCCLDPYHYPIGSPGVPFNKDPVTYHANWGGKKEGKLWGSRADHHGWDESRLT